MTSSYFEYRIADRDLDTITVSADLAEEEVAIELEEDNRVSTVGLSPLQAEELAASLVISAGIARGKTLVELAR